MADATNLQLYHEEWTLRKEGLNSWYKYWTVIRGTWMMFYDDKIDDPSKAELKRTLQLTEETKCALVSRKKNRFPFSINNGRATYYFKCQTELQRYQWLVAVMLSSAQKDAPLQMPHSIPKALIETQVFAKKPQPVNKTKRPNTALPNNRRRQRYNKRLDSKMRRKMEKKGLNSNSRPSTAGQQRHETITKSVSQSLLDMRNLRDTIATDDDDEDDEDDLRNVTIVQVAPSVLKRTQSSGRGRKMSDFDIPDLDVIELDDVDDPYFSSHQIVEISPCDVFDGRRDFLFPSRSSSVVNVSTKDEGGMNSRSASVTSLTGETIAVGVTNVKEARGRNRSPDRGYFNKGLDNESLPGSKRDLRPSSRGTSPAPPGLRSISPATRWMQNEQGGRPLSGNKFSRHLVVPE